MPLVVAKCTQCGANIEVDETKEAGICQYCGTAFITEKAITNYNSYITNNFAGANINVIGGNVKNLLEIAKISLNGGNGKESFEYANKALEVKANCSEAWLIKMRALEYMGIFGDPRIPEVTTCGKNAIDFAADDKKDEIAKEVYIYYLSRALALLSLATQKIRDVDQIKQTFQTFTLVSALTAGQRTAQADAPTINMMEGFSNSALILKLAVPNEIIFENDEYQNLVKEIANQCH